MEEGNNVNKEISWRKMNYFLPQHWQQQSFSLPNSVLLAACILASLWGIFKKTYFCPLHKMRTLAVSRSWPCKVYQVLPFSSAWKSRELPFTFPELMNSGWNLTASPISSSLERAGSCICDLWESGMPRKAICSPHWIEDTVYSGLGHRKNPEGDFFQKRRNWCFEC